MEHHITLVLLLVALFRIDRLNTTSRRFQRYGTKHDYSRLKIYAGRAIREERVAEAILISYIVLARLSPYQEKALCQIRMIDRCDFIMRCWV